MTWDAPFQFVFMQNAFLVGAVIAVPCALLSCFLVLKGWALMGDAVSHAVLPGVVLAWVVGAPLIIGAFLSGMVCALATGFLAENSRVKSDTVMGVVFSGMFALGIVLYTSVETNEHLDHILYGNMLGVSAEELRVTLAIAVVVSALLLAFWRDLLLHAFDAAQAQAVGLPVRWLHYGLLTVLSLTIVATLSSVGLVLAIALLITPGAIGFLVARSFGWMMVVAVIACELAVLGGVYLSFWIDSAPAPTIILILTAIFIAAFARRQILTRRASRIRVQTNTQP